MLGNANSLLPFVTTSVCSAAFILSRFVCFHFFFFPPKEAAEKLREAGTGWRGSRSAQPRIPSGWEYLCAGAAAFVLESCTCYLLGKVITGSVCGGLFLGCLSRA